MALSKYAFDLILELKSRSLFQKKTSVLDMGDQNLSMDNSILLKRLNDNKILLDSEQSSLLQSNDNPKLYLSSSFLWQILGFEKTDRIDLSFHIKRKEVLKNQTLIKHDLNLPIDEKFHNQYDIVTDFGNNEHIFEVSTAFKNMHNFCKKDGYLIISQSLIYGNGFYNFNFDFFETLAAYNNYDIVFSNIYFFFKDNSYINTELDINFLKKIKDENIDSIHQVYVFRRSDEKKFNLPYVEAFPEKERVKLFNIIFDKNSYPFERHYVLTEYNDIKFKDLIKILLSKIFKYIKFSKK